MGTLLVVVLWMAVNFTIDYCLEKKKEKKRAQRRAAQKRAGRSSASAVRQRPLKSGYDWELRKSA